MLYAADSPAVAVAADAAALVTQTPQQQAAPAAVAPATDVQQAGCELVVVDARAPQLPAMMALVGQQAAAGRALQLVTVAAGDDGLAAIDQALADCRDRGLQVTALHLVADDGAGMSRLGSELLDAATIRAHAAQFASWSGALAAGASVLVYGPAADATVAGTTLLPGLAELTGAQVMAAAGAPGALAVADPATSRHEIAFVDTRVPDYQQVIDDLLAGQRGQSGNVQLEVVLLDPTRDGVDQISQVLAQRHDIAAVHLISHGADGMVQLGAGTLDFATLVDQATQISGWKSAFTADGDLLIYGCDVAAAADGQAMLAALAQLTGADVAASVDATGSARLGGNWQLEFHTGAIETAVRLDASIEDNWDGLLAITSNGTATSASTAGATSLTFSHTVASGANRAMFVEIAIDGLGASVNSVTYGGVALTQVGRTAGNHAVEIWRLVAPTVGTANVVVSFGGTTAASAGATTFNGVNQTTPTGTYAAASGTGFTASVAASSATGELVIDAEYWRSDAGTYGTGTGQTLAWSATNIINRGYSSTEAGAASVTMSSTASFATQWEIGAVSIKAAVNTAPTLTNGATVTLTTTNENTTSSGTTVSSILASAGYADADGGSSGIAIISDTSSGSWQYSTDGVTWTTVGAVSATNALLLTSTSQLRYLPDSANGETATLGFKAWDQSTGTASTNATPSFANPGAGGGSTAYSSQSATASITVTSVNDAPVLSLAGPIALGTTTEDAPTAAGPISTLLTNAGYSDVDTGALSGMAVVGASGNGRGQYSTDGVTWVDFGAVSGTNALLLTSTTQVRYMPDGLNGETPTFIFRAWDRTSGTASTNAVPSYVNPGAGGGTTAFSATTVTFNITVTPVNDAPTLTSGATVALAGTTEDATSSGTTVSSILTGAGWADVDTGALSGIAVTTAAGGGAWQYSTDGVTWTAFGAVSGTNALLLTSSSQVRYVPDSFNGETASFGFKAWDRSTGTASTNATPGYANPGAGGGTTAYSSQSASTSLVVSSVNDAPTITNGAVAVLSGTTEDATSSGTSVATLLASVGWADVDTGALKGIVITSSAGLGGWQYSTDGVSWTGFGAVSATNGLLLGSTSQVRYQPNGANGETATFGFRAWDRSTGTASTNATPAYVNPGAGGGTTAYSSQAASGSMTVAPVNDAPVITNGATVTLTATNVVTSSSATSVGTLLTGVSWADVDSGALSGIAVTGATGLGGWQYSTDGVTWTAFGAVSGTNALLLTSTSQVRYVPDGNTPETATLTFVAWDRTTGTAAVNGTPAYASTAVSGGTSAFSSQSASASLAVADVSSVLLVTTLTDNNDSGIATGASYSAKWLNANKGADGAISLREAIIAANNTAGIDTISFNLPGVGVGTIALASALPSITGAIVIDGYTEPGASANTLAVGSNAVLTVELRGPGASGAAFDGLTLAAGSDGSTIRGLIIDSFRGSGIAVSSAGNSFTGNWIGLNNAGTGAAANTVFGIYLVTGGSNTIGSAAAADRNVISGNASNGIEIAGGNSNVIQGNYFGTNAAGTAALANGGAGIYVHSLTGSNQIGGSLAGQGNVISGNNQEGIMLRGGSGSNVIRGNIIGLNATATAALANATGIALSITGSNNQIGGTGATDGNIISGNTGAGIVMFGNGTSGNSILRNSLYGNGGPGIDLGTAAGTAGDGVTANDGTSTAGQPNRWMDSPVISAASLSGGSLTITGYVGSAAGQVVFANSRVEFFLSDGDASGFGEGRTYLGFLTADASGNFSGTLAGVTLAPGDRITATATDTGNNTSEFGANFALNHPPTLTNGAVVALTGTNEDTTSGAMTVAALLAGAGWADADAGAASGIAVISSSASGAWQYSTDGVTWTGFGSVSGASALLLASTTQVRYQPDGLNGETATFSFRAWDQTTGTASTNGSPAHAAASTTDSTSAYSTQSANASITVTSVNDAPVLGTTGPVAVGGTNEDTSSTPGTISTLLGYAGYSDVDTGALTGVAVVGATGNGHAQYSTDGVTWVDFGAVSATNALLLSGSTLARYVPDGANGETPTYVFRAWDMSSGTASTNAVPSYVNPGAGGGSSAFSSTGTTFTITVTAVNDAPTITNGAVVALTGTNEDSASPGTPVLSILTSAGWADVDTGAARGIAITSVSGAGSWQYSLDGSNWTTFTAPGGGNALLLGSTTSVRYLPTGLGAELVGFGFRAWDQSSGTASGYQAPSYGIPGAGGGSTAWSSQSASATLTVTAVNDAPALTVPAAQSISENIALVFSAANGNAITVADIDAAASAVQLTLTAANGTLTLASTSGLSFSNGNGSANPTMTFTGTMVAINAALDGLSFTGDLNYNGTASVSLLVDDLGNTGSGGALTAMAAVTIAVTPTNTAPTLVNGQLVALAGTNEDTASSASTVAGILSSAGWADPDAGASQGIVVVSTSGAGVWQYSLDGSSWTAFGAVSASSGLLLDGATMVRYLPSGAGAETAGFGLRAWDQTSGSASTAGVPVHANPGAGGGTSAYSTQGASATLTVTAVNDAPTLAVPGPQSTLQYQALVFSSANGNALSVGDIDAGAAALQLTLTASNGTLTLASTAGLSFSTGTGSANATMTFTGTLASITNALDGLSFTGNPSYSGPASLSLSVDDLGNTGSGGPLQANASVVITVVHVNSAPTLTNGASVTLAATNEDTVSSGTKVDTLLVSAGLADVDPLDVAGMAVTGVTGLGSWMYSVDGSNWTAFGAVSGASALLLDGNTQVRYQPNGNVGETAGFTFRAWDQSSGTASAYGAPSRANPGAGGGTSAWSTQSATASITVTAVNDAPTLQVPGAQSVVENGTVVFSAANGNAIVASDVDNGPAALQLTLTASNGTLTLASVSGLTFSVGNGSANGTMTFTGTQANINAALDGLSFTGDLNYNGTASVSLLLDDLGNTGAGGALTDTALVPISISAVNNAPVISNGALVTLTGTNEDSPSLPVTVSAMLALAGWSDADLGAASGIAVVSVSGAGAWQYSLDGTSWTGFGTVSGSNALLLSSGTQVRYLPTGAGAEAVGFGLRAWDQTSDMASAAGAPAYADPGAGGGATAYSTQVATASLAVSAVNDAPTVSVPGAQVTTENTTLVFSAAAGNAITVGDIDAGGSAVQLTVSATHGLLTLGSITGLSFSTGTGSGDPTMTFTGTLASINAALDGASFTGDAGYNGAASVSLLLDDLGNSGSGGPLQANVQVGVTINPVNDAPSLSNGALVTLAGTDEDTPSPGTTVASLLTSAGWADIDAAAARGVAVVSVLGGGSWQYSLDGSSWTAFGAVSGASALLLDAGTQVRYLPTGNGAESAGFGFRAWDQTAGSASAAGAPAYANPGAGGGTSAWSSQSAATTISVTAVNDAATIALPGPQTVAEDATLVLSVANGNALSIADIDAGAASVQLTLSASNGTLTLASVTGLSFTSGTGSGDGTMTFTGTLASINAALDGLQFSGLANYAGAAAVSVSVDDLGNTGSGGARITNASLAVTVTNVNDAPVIANGTTISPPATSENLPSSATTVSTLLTGAGWSDADATAARGIAVTSVVASGNWQYSTDGTSWTAFGPVSAGSALLLDAATLVRYNPDGLNGEVAGFTFRAWDQTSGAASANGLPSTANPGAGGGTSAWSTQTSWVTIAVNAVNDAPTIIDGTSVTLPGTDEDTVSAATQVSVITGALGWVDVDNGALRGLAIIGATGNGSWQYSADGVSWQGIGSVSNGSALLLADTAWLRYQPDAANGETAGLTLRAWDQTLGTASSNGIAQYINTSAGGGTSAWSSQTAAVSTIVSAVNDAPTLANGAVATLPSTDENTTSAGTTVDALLVQVGAADPDAGATRGIAVTSTTGNGSWQYSTDGVTWASFGVVAGNSALLLASGTQVRYAPDGLNGETASFDFRAWDQTGGAASTNLSQSLVDPGVGGGVSAWSAGQASASLLVTPINSAPTITQGAVVTLVGTNEDASSPGTTVNTLLLSSGWADQDTAASKGIAVLSTSGNGNWQYSTDGATWTSFGAVSNTSALLLAAGSQVRYQPDGIDGEVAGFSFMAWDQTSGTASTAGVPGLANPGAGGGTSAWSSQIASASLVVSAVNDAPTLLVPSAQTVAEDALLVFSAATGNALLVADVDAGASPLQVTLTATSGLLTLASTAGLSFVSGTGAGDATMTFTGTIAAVNSALDGLVFAAPADYNGAGSLAVAVDDLGNSGAGGALSASATVVIAVTPVNDAPFNTLPPPQTVAEGGTLVLSAANGNALTVGDIDAGGASIQVTLTGTNGLLTLSGTAGLSFVTGSGTGDSMMTMTGTVAAINQALDGLRFAPTAGFNGAASLAILTDDLGNTGAGGAASASGTLAVSVSAVNSPPQLTLPAPQLVVEDATLVFSVANGNAIVVADPDAGAGPVQLTLGVGNGSLTLSGTAGLTFAIGTGTGDGTMTFTGSLAAINAALDGMTYTGALNFSGADSLSLLLDDLGNSGAGGAQTAAAALALTVAAVNDPPTLATPAAQSVAEDGTLVFSAANGNAISVSDIDAGSAPLQLTLIAGNGLLTLSGTAGLTMMSGTGSGDAAMTFSGSAAAINAALDGLVFAPDANFNGAATVALMVNDLGNTGTGGALSASGSVAVNVSAVNDAPVAVIGMASYSATESVPLALQGTGLSIADVDAGNGLLSATLSVGEGLLDASAGSTGVVITGAGSGSLTLSGTLAQINALLQGQQAGQLSFLDGLVLPSAGTTLTLQVNDLGNTGGAALSAQAVTTISVSSVNQAPTLTSPATQTLAEDGMLVFSVANGNAIVLADADAQGALVQLTLTSGHGSLALATTAGLSFVAGADASAAMTITGTVADINAALDGARYRPAANFQGADAIVLLLSDLGNSGGGGPQTVATSIALTVTAVNDAPDSLSVLLSGPLPDASPAGTPVGTALASDPDDPAGLLFSLSDSAGGLFRIDPASGAISVAAPALPSGTQDLQVVVRVTDPAGAWLEHSFLFRPVASNVVVPTSPTGTGTSAGSANDPGGGNLQLMVSSEPDTGAQSPLSRLLDSRSESERLVIGAPDGRSAATGKNASQAGGRAAAVRNVASSMSRGGQPWAGEDSARSVDVSYEIYRDAQPGFADRHLRLDGELHAAVRRQAAAAELQSLASGVRWQPVMVQDLIPRTADPQDTRLVAIATGLEAGGALFSVGAIIWLTRSAGMLAAMLTALPTWRGLDPLVLLAPQEDQRRLGKTTVQNTEQVREEQDAEAIFDHLK